MDDRRPGVRLSVLANPLLAPGGESCKRIFFSKFRDPGGGGAGPNNTSAGQICTFCQLFTAFSGVFHPVSHCFCVLLFFPPLRKNAYVAIVRFNVWRFWSVKE